MIYANSLGVPFAAPAEGQAQRRRPSFFAILLQALMEARQREADRLVAEMIERRGGRLTDDLERRIAGRADVR